VRRFARFWWDFVVGDDWFVAVGIVVALALTALIATTSVPAWWLMPLAVAAVLWVSLWREASAASGDRGPEAGRHFLEGR
jgi:hypothetical protein